MSSQASNRRRRRAFVIYNSDVYCEQAEAFFAAHTVQMSSSNRKRVNDYFIEPLVEEGIFAKLDWFSLGFLQTQQQSLLNIINPAQNAVNVNAVTHTPLSGFRGNGSNSYLNSAWNPVTAEGAKFTRDNASMGVFVGDNISASNQVDIGVQWRAAILTRASGNLQVYPNQSTVRTLGIPGGLTSAGMTSWSRSASNATAAYKNGALISTDTGASLALVSQPFFVCGNNNNGALASPSTRLIQAWFWGASLSGAEHLFINERIVELKTKMGIA